MKIIEKNGHRIAVGDNGIVKNLEELKNLKAFASDPNNNCNGFYAEGTTGNVYDYQNGEAVIIGKSGLPAYILLENKKPQSILEESRNGNESISIIEDLKQKVEKYQTECERLTKLESQNNDLINSLRTENFQLQYELNNLKKQITL